MRLLLAIIMLSALLAPGPVFAQGCGDNVMEALQKYPVAFRGQVTETDVKKLEKWFPSLFTGPDTETTFVVLGAYKGVPLGKVTVEHFSVSQDPAVNVGFNPGAQYLIFTAPDAENGLRLQSCKQVFPVAKPDVQQTAAELDLISGGLEKLRTQLSGQY